MELLIKIRNEIISSVQSSTDKEPNWKNICKGIDKKTNSGINPKMCREIWEALKTEALSNVNKTELQRIAQLSNPKIDDINYGMVYKPEWECNHLMAWYLPDVFKQLIRDPQPEQLNEVSTSDTSSPETTKTKENAKRELDPHQKYPSPSPTKRARKKTNNSGREYRSFATTCNKIMDKISSKITAVLYVAGFCTPESISDIKKVHLIQIQNAVLAHVYKLEGINYDLFKHIKESNEFQLEIGDKIAILNLAKEACTKLKKNIHESEYQVEM